MRRIVASFVIAATVVVGFPPALTFAQVQVATAPVPGPQVVSEAVAGFPGGGDALKMRISDLIYSNPELAADVANYLRSDAAGLNAAQKGALEAGLADGLNRLGVVGFFPLLGLSPLVLGVGAGTAAAGGVAIALTAKKASCTASVSPSVVC